MILPGTVVVTGAAGGLGGALAAAVLAAGARAVLADLDVEGLARAETALASPDRVVAVSADCAVPKGITTVLDAAREQWGEDPDGLVNNAGIFRMALLPELGDDDIDATLAVNARGPMLATRELARRLVAGGRSGAVVNITSTTAHVASLPGLSAYAASKGALLAFTRGAATDLARHGIRVNAVAPGWMRTPMSDPLADPGGAGDRLLARIPMRRTVTPAEVAAAVVWLLSDLAIAVTGATLPVDGGWLAY